MSFFPFCGYADVRSYVKDVIMNLVTVHAQVGGSMCNLILQCWEVAAVQNKEQTE